MTQFQSKKLKVFINGSESIKKKNMFMSSYSGSVVNITWGLSGGRCQKLSSLRYIHIIILRGMNVFCLPTDKFKFYQKYSEPSPQIKHIKLKEYR